MDIGLQRFADAINWLGISGGCSGSGSRGLGLGFFFVDCTTTTCVVTCVLREAGWVLQRDNTWVYPGYIGKVLCEDYFSSMPQRNWCWCCTCMYQLTRESLRTNGQAIFRDHSCELK